MIYSATLRIDTYNCHGATVHSTVRGVRARVGAQEMSETLRCEHCRRRTVRRYDKGGWYVCRWCRDHCSTPARPCLREDRKEARRAEVRAFGLAVLDRRRARRYVATGKY